MSNFCYAYIFDGLMKYMRAAQQGFSDEQFCGAQIPVLGKSMKPNPCFIASATPFSYITYGRYGSYSPIG